MLLLEIPGDITVYRQKLGDIERNIAAAGAFFPLAGDRELTPEIGRVGIYVLVRITFELRFNADFPAHVPTADIAPGYNPSAEIAVAQYPLSEYCSLVAKSASRYCLC